MPREIEYYRGYAVWKTSDGRSLPVNTMTERHILNAYNHMETKLEQEDNIYSVADSMYERRMPSSFIERQREAMRLQRQWCKIFERELARRGITLDTVRRNPDLYQNFAEKPVHDVPAEIKALDKKVNLALAGIDMIMKTLVAIVVDWKHEKEKQDGRIQKRT